MSPSLASILEAVDIRQHVVSLEVNARWMDSFALCRVIIEIFLVNLALGLASHHHELPLGYNAVIFIVEDKVEFNITGITIFIFRGILLVIKTALIDYSLLVVLIVTHETWIFVANIFKILLYDKVWLLAWDKVLLFEWLEKTSFSICGCLWTFFLFQSFWRHKIASGI